MLETLDCPAPEDTAEPAEFTPDWHRQQEAAERAWLDAFARARRFVTAA